MDPTIYIPRIIAQEGIDYLTEHGMSVKVGTSTEEDVLCQEVRGCQGILVRTAQITRRVMEAEPGLRIIARHGTGLDIIDVPAATELGIQVTNTPESNGPSVAELTIGGMISAARRIQELSNSVRQGDFFYKTHCQGWSSQGKLWDWWALEISAAGWPVLLPRVFRCRCWSMRGTWLGSLCRTMCVWSPGRSCSKLRILYPSIFPCGQRTGTWWAGGSLR